MYLILNGEQFRCSGARIGESLLFDFPSNVPALSGAPHGSVSLFQDDGFSLWGSPLDGFARWQVNGQSILITNAPPPPETPPEPSESQLLGQEITDLQLDQIAQGQWITELELNQMEGGATHV